MVRWFTLNVTADGCMIDELSPMSVILCVCLRDKIEICFQTWHTSYVSIDLDKKTRRMAIANKTCVSGKN